MKISSTLRTLAAACAFAVASQAGAAVLQVNTSGILTGATGVNVGGMLYDVTFADGSCNSLFNGCAQSAFSFNTQPSALLAGQALLDQVLINSVAGQFDSLTSKTFGCSSNNCFTVIPYGRETVNLVSTVFVNNVSQEQLDEAFGVNFGESFETSGVGNANYAIFQLAGPTDVPEPTSTALFGLALAGLAFTRRRKA